MKQRKVVNTSLLYVTPVMPSLTGNGLAMRAGMVLEALCAEFSVSVLVVEIYASTETELPAYFQDRCVHSAVVRPCKTQAAAAYQGITFDVVHVFRLACVPFAYGYLINARRHLDLDDIESKTHKRMAALRRSNGDLAGADFELAESRRACLLEAAAVQFFNRVYVCSEQDRSELLQQCHADLRVLPNAVRPAAPCMPAPAGEKFRFLFVANFSYYPNHDAAHYFITEVLPLIKRQPFDVEFVGAGMPEWLCAMAASAGVIVSGRVPDLRNSYAAANAVIAPLRAGGGTRIKILEAFSYRRPVVATSIAMEGIPARHEEQALLADNPETLASNCLRLIRHPELVNSLADSAAMLLSAAFGKDVLARALSL